MSPGCGDAAQSTSLKAQHGILVYLLKICIVTINDIKEIGRKGWFSLVGSHLFPYLKCPTGLRTDEIKPIHVSVFLPINQGGTPRVVRYKNLTEKSAPKNPTKISGVILSKWTEFAFDVVVLTAAPVFPVPHLW